MTEYEYILSQAQPESAVEPLLPTPKYTIQDADTINNARLTGFDAPETFLDTTKSSKLEALGIDPTVMQGMGLKSKEKLKALLTDNPLFTDEGVGYYGRQLLGNDEVANAMIEGQFGVPTDRYDAKKQELYRRTMEKQKAITGTNTEEQETLQILRDYNIDREAPSMVERASSTVDALQSGTVQAVGKVGDFVTDVIGYGADKAGATSLGTWFDKFGEELASTEYADRVTGYDRSESNFAMAEATHQWEMGDYTGALLTAIKTPEVLAESIPLMVEMSVGGGKIKALAKLPNLLKNNIGLATVIGQETNAQAEDFEEKYGEKVSAAKLAEMAAINTVMFSVDRLSFKALLGAKDGIKAAAKAVPDMTKTELMIKAIQVAGVTGKAMGQEGAQEYLQTWGEILNVSDTDMQGYMVQFDDEEKQREALTGGIMGAGGGAQMKGVGTAYQAIKQAPAVAKKVKAKVDVQVDKVLETKSKASIMAGMDELEGKANEDLTTDEVHTKTLFRGEMFKDELAKGNIVEAQKELLSMLKGREMLAKKDHDSVDALTDIIADYAIQLDEKTREFSGTPDENKANVLGSIKVGALSYKDPESVALGLKDANLNEAEQRMVDDYLQEASIVEDARVEFEKTITANKGKNTLEVEAEVIDGPKGINTYIQQMNQLSKSNNLEGANKVYNQLNFFMSSQKEKVRRLKKAVAEMEDIAANPELMNDSVSVDYGTHADGKTARFTVKMKDSGVGTTADSLIARIEASITYGSDMMQEFKPQKVEVQEEVVPVVEEEIVMDEPEGTVGGIEDMTPVEPVEVKTPIKEKVEVEDDKTVQEASSTQETATKPKTLKERVEERLPLRFSEAIPESMATKLEKIGYVEEGDTNVWIVPEEEVNYSQDIIDSDPLATIEKIVKAKGTENVIMTEEFDTLDFPDFTMSVDEAMSGEPGSFLDRLDAKDGKRFSSLAKKVIFNMKGADKRVVATIVKVADDFIITQGMKLAFNTQADMERMLDLPEGTLPESKATILKDAGKFKHVIAAELGGQLMDELGLTQFKDTKAADLEKLKAELGQMVLIYMESTGDIEPMLETRIPEEQQRILYDNEAAKFGISMVMLSEAAYNRLTDPQARADLKAYHKAMGENLGTNNLFVKHEVYEKPGHEKFKVKGTKVSTVSKEAAKQLNKAQKQEWELSNPEYELLMSMDRDLLLENLGYTPEAELENLAFADREKAVVNNREAMESIQALEDMQDRLSVSERIGFFYKWFFSKNGRFFLDSNGVNPQTDKLHRYIVGLKSNTVELNTTNDKHMNIFHIGLAQAFGHGIDKFSVQSSIDFGKAVLAMDIADVEALLKPGYKGDLEIEEIGHAIQGVNAVKAFKAAKDGKFTTNLTVEIDAVTSGTILKLLQLPNNPRIEELLAKGGFVSSGLDMFTDFTGTNNELGGGMLTDMYKTMAKTMSNKKSSAKTMLSKIKSGKVRAMKLQIFNDLQAPAINSKSAPIMPKFTDAKGNVSKAARNLFKPVVMVFSYGANIKNIKKAFANNILDSIPQRILDGDKNALNLLLSGAGDTFAGMNPKTLKALIKEKDVLDLKYKYIDYQGNVVTGRKTIRETLSSVIEETYGEDLQIALEALFPGMMEMNAQISNGFKLMFNVFETEYDKEVAKLGEDMTIKQEQAIFEKLIVKFPGLRAPLQDIKQKMEIVDSERVTGQASAVTYVNPEIYDQKSISVNTMLRQLKAAVAAGVVLPIHNIDGSIQTKVLNTIEALGVHDANMFNMLQAMEGNMAYNEESFKISKEYSWISEAVKAISLALPEDVSTIMIGEQTGTEIMDALYALEEEVNTARDTLFSNNFKVDHATGLGAVFETSVEQEVLMSQEYEMDLDNFVKKVDTKINNDPEAMNDLLDFVVDMDEKGETEEHMNHLKKILNSFVSTTGKFLKDMDVLISDKETQNVGAVDLDVGAMYLGINKGGVTADKSMAEIYVHEVVHAATAYARRTAGSLKGADLARINKLYLKAAKVLTVADFEDFTATDKAAEYDRAKTQYDYIFNNIEGNGVDEFMAHGLTNEKVIAALKKIKVYDAKSKKPTNLYEQIEAWFMQAWEFITSRARGESGIRADELLFKLSLNLAEANNATTQKAKRNMVDRVWEALDVVNKPTLAAAAKLEAWLVKGDVKPIERDENGKMSKWSMFKWVILNIKKIMAGDERVRKNAMWILGRMGMSPRGAIAQILRVYNEKDSLHRNMERLLLEANTVDNEKTHDEQAIMKALEESAQTELDAQDKLALGSYVIEGDMAAIFDDYTAAELEAFYRDPVALSKEITRLQGELTGKSKDYYIAQAKGLGQFMALGTTKTRGQMMNAHNINNKLGTTDMFKDVNKANEKVIDTLATLYAITNQNPEGKVRMADIIQREYAKNSEDNVIITTNKLLQLFKDQSKDKLFDTETGKTASNVVKGYSKELVNNETSIETVDMARRKEMEDRGYELVRRLGKDKHDTAGIPMGLFISKDDGIAAYQRGSLHITNKRHKGSSLFSTSAEDASSRKENVDLAKLNKSIMKKKIAETKNYKAGKHTDTTKQLVPILDREGFVVEYRYMMSKHDRVTLLDKDTSYDKLLGRMFSSMTDKSMSEDMNQHVIDTMLADSTENRYADDYVFIGKDSNKKEHRDMWRLLPESLQMYIEKESGEKGIAVRKDLQDMVFGYRKGSITDFKFFENKTLMKRYVKMAEKALAFVATHYKLDIVIKTPAVFVGNIVSNTALLMMNGIGPLEATKLQKEGVVFLDEYKSAQSDHTTLNYKVDAGLLKGSKLNYAKRELVRLQEIMDRSPIKKMVDSGLFQTIVEDLGIEEESKFSNKYMKAAETVASKAPKWIRTGANYAYMTERTPMYRAMLKGTQYSDFVARYAMMVKLKAQYMAEGMSEVEAEKLAFEKAVDSYIPYDVPDSKLVQYLNDHGFLMFTKYFMGIQNVLKNLTQKNPLYAVAMLLGVNAVYDLEDVYEQSVFVKDIGSMVHMPLEGLGELWKPSSLQAIDKYII